MTIDISIPDTGPNLRPLITVIGVGGSGGNAVNNMMNCNLEGVDFLIANTDAQALQNSECKRKIQLGLNSTKGLGAGMRPDIGKEAAEEAIDEINEKLDGSHMLFIAAGMGGGTGTGAAPVIAKLAREKGILTVGVVTKPFHFEGSQRMKLANKGIDELQQFVDTLLIIPNQNLFRIANEKTTFADAFKMADDVLYAGVRGVTDLMVQPGLINLDFSDVKTVMSEMGKAMMGTGEASGDGRSVLAAEAAITNPLIDDVSLKGARGLIINITGGKDITLYEVDEAANRIKQEVDENANIIYGTTCDERLEGTIRVSIVATGIDVATENISKSSSENKKEILIDNSVYKKKSIEANFDAVLANTNTPESNEKTITQETFSDNENQEIFLEEKEALNGKEKIESTSELETHDIDVKLESEEININLETHQNEEKIEDLESHSNDEILKEDSEKQVRRLSLFDIDNSIDESKPEKVSISASEDINQNKNEPFIEKSLNSSIMEQEDTDININEEERENQEKHEESIEEDGFNQDPEEELLDIPTFLRRQAN